MVGILVYGDNCFIVRGPLPDREVALALIRHCSPIQNWSHNTGPSRSVGDHHARAQGKVGTGSDRARKH